MAFQNAIKSLAKGRPTKLNDSLITGITTLDFDIVSHTNAAGDFSVLFQAVGTVTGLVVDLQFSLDNGVTFSVLVANLLVAATPFKLQTPLVSGARYRLNVSGAPTSADIYAVPN
jgi:hypothetical protein